MLKETAIDPSDLREGDIFVRHGASRIVVQRAEDAPPPAPAAGVPDIPEEVLDAATQANAEGEGFGWRAGSMDMARFIIALAANPAQRPRLDPHTAGIVRRELSLYGKTHAKQLAQALARLCDDHEGHALKEGGE